MFRTRQAGEKFVGIEFADDAQGNQRLAQVSQIRKFHLLTKELDHDDGEVTATMKVRRASIYKTYAAEIEALYQ